MDEAGVKAVEDAVAELVEAMTARAEREVEQVSLVPVLPCQARIDAMLGLQSATLRVADRRAKVEQAIAALRSAPAASPAASPGTVPAAVDEPKQGSREWHMENVLRMLLRSEDWREFVYFAAKGWHLLGEEPKQYEAAPTVPADVGNDVADALRAVIQKWQNIDTEGSPPSAERLGYIRYDDLAAARKALAAWDAALAGAPVEPRPAGEFAGHAVALGGLTRFVTFGAQPDRSTLADATRYAAFNGGTLYTLHAVPLAEDSVVVDAPADAGGA